MNWHTSMTTSDDLHDLVASIRERGGTVACCLNSSEGIAVTWFVLDGALVPERDAADVV